MKTRRDTESDGVVDVEKSASERRIIGATGKDEYFYRDVLNRRLATKSIFFLSSRLFRAADKQTPAEFKPVIAD